LSMPYAILACNLPASKMGLYMGMFNILIVAPQLVANLGGGFLLRALFGNHAILMLVLSGVSMLIAAALSMWVVQESD
jgi:maltose/moltooligosaccharide transporter